MPRKRSRVIIGDEQNPFVVTLKVIVCVLAPIFGFFAAYPIMRLVDLIKGLF